MNKVTNKPYKIDTSGVNNFGKAITQVGKQVTNFGNLATTVFERLGSFVANYLAQTITTAVFKSMRSAIDNVVEFDKSVQELQKVVGAFTDEELRDFSTEVTNIGERLSSTMTEVTNAVTTFVKTGASLEDSLRLSEVAIQMQHTADETLAASDAAETLIAITRAYPDLAKNEEHIADAINQVSANYAISSGQIITNINKVAATMAVGNTSFEKTLGLITGITEVTRNASKASQALKTIGQRLRGVGEDAEEGLTAKLQGAFDTLGIGIDIIDKQTREVASTGDILDAIAARWNDLTDDQRQYIGELAAGKMRITEFNALMLNYDRALEATADAYDSAGITAKQFGVYQDSIEGKLNAIKEQWQELVAEGGGINKFIKLVLDAGTALLKFANDDITQTIVKIGAISLAIKTLYSGFTKLYTLFATKTMTGVIFDATAKSTMGLGGAIKALTATMFANPLFWTVAGGLLLFGITKILEADTKKFERLNEVIEENNQKIQELQSEYDQLSGKPIEDLTEAEKVRLNILEEQLRVLKEQNKEKQKQAYEAIPQAYASVEVSDKYLGIGGGLGVGAAETTRTAQIAVEDYIKSLKTLNGVETENKQVLADHAEQLLRVKEAGNTLKESDEEFLETYNLLLSTTNYINEAYEKYGTIIGGNVSKAVQTATVAIKEQTEQGKINQQTYEDLIAIYPQMVDYIAKEGKEYVLNTAELKKLLTAENLEQISINQSKKAAVDYINTLGDEKLAYTDTISTIKQAIAARMEDAKSRMVLGALSASAYNELNDAEKKEYLVGQEARAAAVTEYSELQNILRNFNVSIDENSYSIRGNTSVVEEETEALKDSADAIDTVEKSTQSATDSFKQFIQVMQQVIQLVQKFASTVKQSYDDSYGYAIDLIDEQIDKLQEQRDAEEEVWDNKIQALQDANRELEDQIALEEALKNLEEAKARKTFIYREGEGFVYGEDTKAIQEAQTGLDELQRRIDLEKQISQLEEMTNAALDSIDTQIDGWQRYRTEWEKTVDDYEKQQQRLAASQKLGANIDARILSQDLGVVQDFSQGYIGAINTVAKLEKVSSVLSTISSVLSIVGSISSLVSGIGGGGLGLGLVGGILPRANGTKSDSGGIRLVGEKGAELQVINRGDGIIPAKMTENLMKLGQYSPSDLVKTISHNVRNRDVPVVQNFGNINLPNVHNASQFVDELKRFKQYAIQSQSKR